MLKRPHPVCGLLLIAVLAGVVRAEKIPYANSKIVPPTPEWATGVDSDGAHCVAIQSVVGGRILRFTPNRKRGAHVVTLHTRDESWISHFQGADLRDFAHRVIEALEE